MHRHTNTLCNACSVLDPLLLSCHHFKRHPLFSVQATSLAYLVILPLLLFTTKIPPSSVGNLAFQLFPAMLTSAPYLDSILSTPQPPQVPFLEALLSIPEALATLGLLKQATSQPFSLLLIPPSWLYIQVQPYP